MLELAEDLLKFAKKEGAKQESSKKQETKQGLINFQVISSSNSLEFGENFKKLYVMKNPPYFDKELYRTLRPYTSEDMKNLISKVHTLKNDNFPKNKLQALQEAVFLDHGNSTLSSIAVLSRLKAEQKKNIIEVFNTFANIAGINKWAKWEVFPWFSHNSNYYNPFLDIAEIFDFIS